MLQKEKQTVQIALRDYKINKALKIAQKKLTNKIENQKFKREERFIKVAQRKTDLELEDRKRKALLLTKEMEGKEDFRTQIVPEYSKTMSQIKLAAKLAEEELERERK